MPRKYLPTSFPAERAVLDMALANGGGTYDCGDPGKATYFRQRCYLFRKALRDQALARDTLNLGDVSTPYDAIKIDLEKGSSVLHFTFAQPVGVFRAPDGKPVAHVADKVKETADNDFAAAARKFAEGLRPGLASSPSVNLDPEETD